MVLSPAGRAIVRLTVAAAVARVLAGCGGDEGAASEPYVVATTSIWADVVGMVACDGSMEVRTIVPSGGDPHAYEPSLRDRDVLDGAALVVINGVGLEERLADTLDEVAAGGVPVFALTDHVDLLPPATAEADDSDQAAHADDVHAVDEEHEQAGEGHDHEGADPHVWFDPTRVAAALPELGAAIVSAGAERVTVERCVEAARAELATVDSDVEAALAAVPDERRVLVTNHDSLGYFAHRYGFDILGTVLPSASTLTEANPADLQTLADEIDAHDVPAIFTESLHASTDAEALGDRLGVEVVELHTDSLGPPDSEAGTYAGLLRTDARLIASALGD